MLSVFRSRLHHAKRTVVRINGHAYRPLSSPASSPEDKNNDKDDKTFLGLSKPQMTQGLVMGGLAITVYGLGSFMLDVTYGLMSMTPLQSGYYGFITGFATAGMGGSLLYYGKQHIAVNTHTALWKSTRALNSHDEARTVMGGSLVNGELAAYSHTRGYWHIASWRPAWQPARLKMIFNVHSAKAEGVVSVEAVQNGLQTDVTFIGLDVLNEHNSRILVRGHAKGFESHDAMRAMVSFKSVKQQ